MSEKDTSVLKLRGFNPDTLNDNSVITMFGTQTNHKLLFKRYGKDLFENFEQFQKILHSLPEGHFLVIDQTCPNNRLQNMVFYYKP